MRIRSPPVDVVLVIRSNGYASPTILMYRHSIGHEKKGHGRLIKFSRGHSSDTVQINDEEDCKQRLFSLYILRHHFNCVRPSAVASMQVRYYYLHLILFFLKVDLHPPITWYSGTGKRFAAQGKIKSLAPVNKRNFLSSFQTLPTEWNLLLYKI